MEREAKKHEIGRSEAGCVLGRVLDEPFWVAAQVLKVELDHQDCAVRGPARLRVVCVAIQVFAYDIERLWRQIWRENAIGHVLCKGYRTESTTDELIRSCLAGFAVKDKVRVRPARRCKLSGAFSIKKLPVRMKKLIMTGDCLLS